MIDLVWSFAPWLVFIGADRFTSFGGALLAGLAAAVIVLVRAIIRHHVHLLDVVSTSYFGLLGVALLVVDPINTDTWSRYAQAGAHGLITVVVLGSVLVGRPFTESYARSRVPQAFWDSPEFHDTNRRISLAFGLAFLAGTISLVVAGALDTAPVIFRVLVPFGAIAGALKYTQSVSGGRTEQPATPLSS